jgi:hypothetical protein
LNLHCNAKSEQRRYIACNTNNGGTRGRELFLKEFLQLEAGGAPGKEPKADNYENASCFVNGTSSNVYMLLEFTGEEDMVLPCRERVGAGTRHMLKCQVQRPSITEERAGLKKDISDHLFEQFSVIPPCWLYVPTAWPK